MFYALFSLLAVYALITLAFAITSFGEKCVRAGVLGSIMFLIMLGLPLRVKITPNKLGWFLY